MIGFSNNQRFYDYKNRLRIKGIKFHSDVYFTNAGRVIYTITIL